MSCKTYHRCCIQYQTLCKSCKTSCETYKTSCKTCKTLFSSFLTSFFQFSTWFIKYPIPCGFILFFYYFCGMFRYLFLGCVALCTISCSEETRPKPKGELRLEYPKAKYQAFNSACPFTFEYSDFAALHEAKKPCWYNLVYPQMKANVFLTYFPIQNDFRLHVKEVEKMVYEHTIRASAIETKSFSYPEKRVFGNFYELKGQSASNIQIFLTDSTRHFVTANLYFKSRPRPDSLQPAIDYIKEDLMHMIETFNWK